MFELDTYGTLVAASLVLLLGKKLVQWFPVFKTYTIPETIVGGLFASIVILSLKTVGNIELHFDTSIRDPLMLAFFATVGLNANIMKLRKGGKVLIIFLTVVCGLLLLQNIVGIGTAILLGVDPLMGLLGGSITMHGGHATGAAWADIFSTSYSFSNASEVAMACATFGLIFGGLLGGPVSSYLMKRTPVPENTDDGQDEGFEKPSKERLITSSGMIESIAMIAISLSVGSVITAVLKGTPYELPSFVCVLFVGVVLSNSLSMLGLYNVFERMNYGYS